MIESGYRSHAIHARLGTIAEGFTQLDTDPWAEAPPEAIEYLRAARTAFDYVRRLIAIQEAPLVSAGLIEAIDALLTDIINALEAYRAAPSLEGARQLNASIERLVERSAQLPNRLNDEVVVVAEPILQTMREESEALRRDITAAADEAKATAEAANSSIQVLATSTTAQLDAKAQTIEDRAVAVDGQLTTASESLNSALLRFEARTQTFEEQRAAISTQITESLTGIESRFSAAETQRASAHTTAVTAAKTELDDLTAKLNTTQADAEEVLQLAGGAALSARWIRQAHDQRIERGLWIGGIIGLLMLVFLLGWAHLDRLTAPHGSSITDAIVFYVPRVPFAIITITVLGFLIQQASRRALWEARDRRVANELTAFPSFIAGLPETEASTFRANVATKYFPGPEVDHDEPRRASDGERAATDRYGALAGSITGMIVLALVLLYALSKI